MSSEKYIPPYKVSEEAAPPPHVYGGSRVPDDAAVARFEGS